MSQIGLDKTSIQAVVLSKKCYLKLLLSNAEISLKSKTVVCMPRDKNNEICPKRSIHIAVISLYAKFDIDRLKEDHSGGRYVQNVNFAW